MTTKTERAHDVRKVLQSVKDYWSQASRPKLSEADTRALFLDPLLRALDYQLIGDIQREVYVETAKQYLDYQLVVDALPRVAVEAKAIEVGLNDSHGAQVVQYCSVLGIEWAVVTNARQWRLYHGFAQGPLSEKLVAAVDLLAWETDAEFGVVFEQLWLVSKEAFQTSGGPGAWLIEKQLDRVLRKAITDASSPEIRYIRNRLAGQGIATSVDHLAAWFKMHVDGAGSSGQIPAGPQVGGAPTPAWPAATGTPIQMPKGATQPGDSKKTTYLRLMLGAGSVHAAQCVAGGFVGTDYGIVQDLASDLPEDWRTFNKKFIPVYLAANPGKSRVVAGLACGAVWKVSKGLQVGDVVLSPNGKGQYHVGRISGAYHYEMGGVLPHRRAVTWLPQLIQRASMSEALQNSTGSIGAISDVSSYRDEIDSLIAGQGSPATT